MYICKNFQFSSKIWKYLCKPWKPIKNPEKPRNYLDKSQKPWKPWMNIPRKKHVNQPINLKNKHTYFELQVVTCGCGWSQTLETCAQHVGITYRSPLHQISPRSPTLPSWPSPPSRPRSCESRGWRTLQCWSLWLRNLANLIDATIYISSTQLCPIFVRAWNVHR